MAGPLSHIKVLDMSRVLAAPWAAQNLADLGADVIKIERPVKGDDSRAYAPPFLKDQNGKETKESAYFCAANRGKRSITVNLTKPEGQQLVRELAAQADVLLENYKVGDLARYGLGYEDLAKINPGLIYCSVTGFGQTGPYKDRPGYDFMAQGMGGLMYITGMPGQGPVRAGIAVADVGAGLHCAIGILIALLERESSGQGQWISTSLLQAMISMCDFQAARWTLAKDVPGQAGNNHPTSIPTGVFKTKDGYINIAASGDHIYKRFCESVKAPELLTDPKFSSGKLRAQNRDALNAEIGRASCRERV